MCLILNVTFRFLATLETWFSTFWGFSMSTSQWERAFYYRTITAYPITTLHASVLFHFAELRTQKYVSWIVWDITTKIAIYYENTGISPFMTKRYYYCIVDIEFHGCMVYTNLSLLCQILIAFSIYFVFAPAIRFDKNYNTHSVWITLYFRDKNRCSKS